MNTTNIIPIDKQSGIVTYNEDKKIFSTEISVLEHMGIRSAILCNGGSGSGYVLYNPKTGNKVDFKFIKQHVDIYEGEVLFLEYRYADYTLKVFND